MVYIEGYSLISSLGESAKDSAKAIQNSHTEPIILKDGNRFYNIKNRQEDDYYDLIERITQEAIESANLTPEDLSNIALFVGTCSALLPINEAYAKINGDALRELDMSTINTKISHRLGIKGFSSIISTACTSSSNALLQAKEMIESGLVEKAIVVGVELYNEVTLKGFESFMLLSKERMRPFDSRRDGVILGEALSALVLGKTEGEFEIVSGSIKVDTTSITSPTPTNLSHVMREAISQAKIEPKDIVLIKTHSTSTRQNDDAESKAIHMLFDTLPPITGLKPYIGHTMGACGTSELVLLIEAIRQGFIPKSINFQEQDSECNIIPLEHTIEPKEGYYLLNYFGFGGNNSSLVIKYSKLPKLGTDGFSLVTFGTKVSDSKKFCKMSNGV
ncbi:hypothetical protein GSY74_10515 [Sulfurovum sp. bin170]|uniref:beta-ketoacyl synthase N-terminal-like domain-containing protein n=1 Tax=Sulfurovum sp. bin170 TaxID=2695268 RepID=UPI0013E0E618|nr:beta-ketoacyl synthase N-terminal-like domain-containing protein [Sulfurovum sp. bin170]NEW61719.1 hypothetical protein [Sulfurovum sp. bin170]